MNEAEQRIAELLTRLQIKVAPIAADPKYRRADLRSHDEDNTEYLIEVKSRSTDENFYQELSSKGEVRYVEPSGRTNVTSRKIKDAADQLSSTPSITEPFRIIAFVSFQDDSDVDTEQFRATLYGMVDLIIPPDADRNAKALPCFYFTYTDFMRYKIIDAAIILTNGKTQLCPNPFGNRAEAFKQTLLYRKYFEFHAIFDPIVLEQSGKAFLADTELDRRDKDGIINYLKEKYKLSVDPTVIELKLHKYATQIKPDEFAD